MTPTEGEFGEWAEQRERDRVAEWRGSVTRALEDLKEKVGAQTRDFAGHREDDRLEFNALSEQIHDARQRNEAALRDSTDRRDKQMREFHDENQRQLARLIERLEKIDESMATFNAKYNKLIGAAAVISALIGLFFHNVKQWVSLLFGGNGH